MKRLSPQALVLSVALLASACSGADDSVDTASQAAEESVGVVDETPEVSEAAEEEPDATTTTTTTAAPTGQLVNLVGGGQLDLNSIEGTDTVLWFWAPW